MTRIFVTFLLVLEICQASFLFQNDADNEDYNVHYRLPSTDVMPTHYKLHITPDINELKFDGEVDITLIALRDGFGLKLNSMKLKIKSVELMDLNTTKTFETHLYVMDGVREMMIIRVQPSFRKDHHLSLKVNYSGEFSDNMRGFYRSRMLTNEHKLGYVAATHFEPTNARLAFPCWDEPIYKAKFTISLTHSWHENVISNTDAISMTQGPAPDYLVTTTFKETPLMSTYLVAFLVGRYEYNEIGDEDGFRYRAWAQPSAVNKTDYALDKCRQLLEVLNAYTGIPYQKYMPHKIDLVALQDFTEGAMENWGIITFRDTNLLYDERRSSTNDKKRILRFLAHELSHQWFGNLVTPKWWKYIWLNEGFSNYFQYFIAHKVEPVLRMNDMFVVENMQATAMVTDADPKTTKMNQDAYTPAQIEDLFNDIAYTKAGSVIRMMHHVMTEEIFHRGLQIYLTSHALGSVDSDDLAESLQKAFNETARWKRPKCRLPMKEVLTQWAEQPGYPVVTVTRVKEGYQLTQEHFVMAMVQVDEFNAKWPIPITYVEESNPNFNNTYPVNWLDSDAKSLIVHTKQKKGWFIFNTQQAGYYRVNYNEENWKLLTHELNKGNFSKIHVLNRAQLIDDAFNMAQTNRLNYAIALNLTLYLRHETDYMPWQPFFRHIYFLRNLMRTSNKYHTFNRYLAYLLRGVTKHIGCKPKKGDSELVKLLRDQVFDLICRAHIDNCVSYAEDQYHLWLEDPTTLLDTDLMFEILCIGVKSANVSTWHKTKEHLIATTDDPQKRIGLMRILAYSNSSAILKEYLYSTLDEDSPIALHFAAQHVVLSYFDGPQLVYDFLIKEYKRIEEIENFQNVVQAVAGAISSGITDIQLHLNLSGLLLDEKLKHMLRHVMTESTRNMIWIHKYRPTVEKWLDDNSQLFESTDDESNTANSIAIVLFPLIFSLFITQFY